MKRLASFAQSIARYFGFEVVKYTGPFAPDFDPASIELIKRVSPFTMTTPERVYGLIQAVEYVVKGRIPGAIVECGVWRGGSMMTVAFTLMRLGVRDRDLYLFDTFDGMSRPTDVDRTYEGKPASKEFDKRATSGDSSSWFRSSLDETRRNLLSTGYPPERIKFIKGKVEDTIPDSAPAEIALLRLDTDWYESTSHELLHMYPRIHDGGVLLIDDYGHWQGSRLATDEYFERQESKILLNRVDYTGRIGVKPGSGSSR